MNSIGIGITTTSNRKAIFERAILQIRYFAPKDAKIVTITDTVGIAKAKNQCLALLDDCEHIFLFDDDTYPITDDWHSPYIESGEPHLSYTFRRKVLGINAFKNTVEYERPCGCMIYINRDCLDKIGGFDESYQGWGHEHTDFSNRVYNAGLTSARFLDLRNSKELIHSMDEHKEVKSSLTNKERVQFLGANGQLLKQNWDSKEFKAYK